jgi:hypothetical protein
MNSLGGFAVYFDPCHKTEAKCKALYVYYTLDPVTLRLT